MKFCILLGFIAMAIFAEPVELATESDVAPTGPCHNSYWNLEPLRSTSYFPFISIEPITNQPNSLITTKFGSSYTTSAEIQSELAC